MVFACFAWFAQTLSPPLLSIYTLFLTGAFGSPSPVSPLARFSNGVDTPEESTPRDYAPIGILPRGLMFNIHPLGLLRFLDFPVIFD